MGQPEVGEAHIAVSSLIMKNTLRLKDKFRNFDHMVSEVVGSAQRDVPGLTRSAVPVLTSQGVTSLSVGVNGGSAPPGVPKFTPFWWADEPSGTRLLAFWHPGGAAFAEMLRIRFYLDPCRSSVDK